ncbi:MAG: aminoacyl-tRNA hydrolase [Actinomycetota bacterium]|nr:aminoacyl-tRNA hydrolase [Actinomycetota bacterium]
MSAWLVVGLGNPGDRYADTRHNIGTMVVSRLAERLGVRLRKTRFLPAESADARAGDDRLWLLRPLTYMNVSGPPVASFARRHRIEPERVVVCHDELDLPFGAIKLKLGGSTAGHRGLASLATALRSPGFHRVRLGIGRPPGRQDPADFVLRRFSAAERDGVPVLVENAADAVVTLVNEGLAVAQDRHNRSGP